MLGRKRHVNLSFLFPNVDRNMTSGWQGPTHFRRYGREMVSKPAISLKKSWGGLHRRTA